jgi:hypothetical protein
MVKDKGLIRINELQVVADLVSKATTASLLDLQLMGALRTPRKSRVRVAALAKPLELLTTRAHGLFGWRFFRRARISCCREKQIELRDWWRWTCRREAKWYFAVASADWYLFRCLYWSLVFLEWSLSSTTRS